MDDEFVKGMIWKLIYRASILVIIFMITSGIFAIVSAISTVGK